MASKLKVKKTGKGASNVTSRNVPEIPFRAPAGSYDVGLDAAERASSRGLQDLLNQLSTQQDRADVQSQWGQQDITRNRDQALGDLSTRNDRFGRDLGISRQRGTEDYNTNSTRLGEDYQSSLANLARNYQRLGQSQKQGFLSAGGQAGGGGALKQAARKRAENQAWDRKPIDTGYQRSSSDLNTAWGRQQQDWNNNEADWNKDYTTQTQRIGDSASRDLGRLAVTGNWDSQDRITQGQQAQRENTYFGQDTQAARVQQVQQTAPGWLDQWRQNNKYRGFQTF